MTRGFRPATDDVRSLPKRWHRARRGAGGRALRGGLEYRYDTARHRPDRTRSAGGTGTAGPECAGGGDTAYHRHPQRQPAAPRSRQTHQIDAVDRGPANHERLDQSGSRGRSAPPSPLADYMAAIPFRQHPHRALRQPGHRHRRHPAGGGRRSGHPPHPAPHRTMSRYAQKYLNKYYSPRTRGRGPRLRRGRWACLASRPKVYRA